MSPPTISFQFHSIRNVHLDRSLVFEGAVLCLRSLLSRTAEAEVEDDLATIVKVIRVVITIFAPGRHEEKVKEAAIHYGNYSFNKTIVKGDKYFKQPSGVIRQEIPCRRSL